MNFDIYLSFFNNYLYFCISFPFFYQFATDNEIR